MNRFLVLAAFLFSTAIFSVSAQTRVPVSDIRQAFISVVSTKQPIRGVFTGDLADFAGKEFVSLSPILIDIAIAGSHPQSDCARLSITFTQQAVQLRNRSKNSSEVISKPRNQNMQFNLNYCVSGFPANEQPNDRK